MLGTHQANDASSFIYHQGLLHLQPLSTWLLLLLSPLLLLTPAAAGCCCLARIPLQLCLLFCFIAVLKVLLLSDCCIISGICTRRQPHPAMHRYAVTTTTCCCCCCCRCCCLLSPCFLVPCSRSFAVGLWCCPRGAG